MGVTVDLESDDLTCKSQKDAEAAAAIIAGDADMKSRLEVVVHNRSSPPREDDWALTIEYYDACHWNEEAVRRLCLALAPHMAEDASIEFRTEDSTRFRFRWSGGRVFEEYPLTITWGNSSELTPPRSEGATP